MVLISFVINSLVKVLYLWIYNSSGNDSLIYLSLFVDAVTRTLTRVLTLLVCMGYSSPAGITHRTTPRRHAPSWRRCAGSCARGR